MGQPLNVNLGAPQCSLNALITRIQRFCIHDGPGLRTTVFFKGCTLHCAWCHNPEAIDPKPQLIVLGNRCVRCGLCIKTCPVRIFSSSDIIADSQIPTNCKLCGKCVEICPGGARQIIGTQITLESLLEELLRDRPFYEQSGGGITFSGGEPLMQLDFVMVASRLLKSIGVHVAIDTSGMISRDKFLQVISGVDLVLFDLKIIDNKRFRYWCGGDNHIILENLQQLEDSGVPYWIRIPIIPGINDIDSEIEAMLAILSKLRNYKQVNLLPYHRTGMSKFMQLGLDYKLKDIIPPTQEYMEKIAFRFKKVAPLVKIGG